MSVRLDHAPTLALRPARPRGGCWLVALPLLLLLMGVGGAFWFDAQSLREQSSRSWVLALGAPLLVWCLLSFVRVLLYLGQQQVADGWDKAREEDLIHKVRRGRRVQQVLSVSLHTALRESDGSPTTQLDSLRNEVKAIAAQPSRKDHTVLRHTRIAGDVDEASQQALLKVLKQVLADLIPALKQLSDDSPLAVLLEIESALLEIVCQDLWQQAWNESGICQPIVPVEGHGLAALDHWLDQRIGDQACLLVVALQFAPYQPEGTAEVAVGLLFGNRLTQSMLPPIAHLHRPEQEREPTTDALLYAAKQALDWVPLDAQSIEHTWRSGVDSRRGEALSRVLTGISLPAQHNQGYYNVDALLGHAGKASMWLAIAAATQTIQGGAGPQFIICGSGCVDAALWSTVLTPVPSLGKQEL